MYRYPLPATAIALAMLLQPIAAVAQTDYQTAFQQLVSIAPTGKRAAVTNLTIERDAGVFRLHDGTLHVLTPVADRVVGAFFSGSGTFAFTPATAVERAQLQRQMQTDRVWVDIKTLFLLFADSTMQELEQSLEFTTGPPPGNIARELREALEYLSDDDTEWFDTDLMMTFLNQQNDGTFYAHFAEKRGDPLIFRINPRSGEAVSLSRRSDDGKYAELVASQHTATEIARGEFETDDDRDLVSLDGYTIESSIKSNLDYSALASFDITSLDDSVSWAPLRLYRELEVDTVSAEDAHVTWHRGDKASTLWLRFNPALKEGASQRVTVAYHGDLFDRADLLEPLGLRGNASRAWMIEMKSTNWWFPRSGSRRTATFDLTYHAPEKYVLVSVGDPVESGVTDKVRTTRWKTKKVRNVAFNIGEFEEYHFNDPRVPPITLHVDEKMHNSLVLYARDGTPIPIRAQQDMDGMVIADLTNSMSFFQDFYGPATVNQFYATETPYYHGEAYPGLVLLSWVTFQWTDEKGSDDMFRAHEVAHQWWGIGVDFATYRDQWLSEGFSEFAGLWYMQIVRFDNDLYFEKLDDWRDELLDRRKDIGPISLGYRVSTSKHPGDYSLVVYRKGAWVLHMLRSLLLDLETMNEDRFKALMSDFYQTYRGERASTADFQKMVETHIGAPMDWFFDQWVHGTAIPTYRVSYSGEDTPEGFRARINVIQEDVPDDFKMIVPVLLDFGTDGYAHVRMMVEGPVTDVELPLLPRKPDKIVFNDLESVLADVKGGGWKN